MEVTDTILAKFQHWQNPDKRQKSRKLHCKCRGQECRRLTVDVEEIKRDGCTSGGKEVKDEAELLHRPEVH